VVIVLAGKMVFGQTSSAMKILNMHCFFLHMFLIEHLKLIKWLE